ncbi:MAG: peptidoglycan editing factor PgeF [Thermodesulfovibrio sp.]|nr:peptidoglycan editing factor PgeF [Thermodesulfovibrio sp.]
MKRFLFPENIRSHSGQVTAFFTGKDPGSDLGEIAGILRQDAQQIYLPIQKHTDTVMILDTDLSPKIADAVVTIRKNILIGVRVADCVPILLYDPCRRVIGAVHAGWRGTAAGILKNTLRTFTERFSCNSMDIQMAIGPSIKSCCYEVDPDVASAVAKASDPDDHMQVHFIRKKGAKYHVDLPLANKDQALAEGIREENIWITEDCTFCHPEKYCSFRYAKGTACRQGGFIGML